LKFDRINAPIHEYLYKLQKIYNPVLPSSLRGNGNLGYIMGPAAEARDTGLGAETRTILKTAPASRIYFLDNLKVLLAVLVILQHSAQPYGPGGGWWIAPDPNQNIIDYIVLGFLMVLNMSFFMGLFFMISAYFAPGSLDRKSPAKFLRDRLIKLGIPVPIFMFCVFPAMGYLLFDFGQPVINSYLNYLNIFSPHYNLEFGHLWFLVMLLIFSAVYAAYWFVKSPSSKPKRAFPGNAAIFAFVMTMALVSFAVRIWAPVNYWVPLHLFEPFHLTQYILLFAAGIVAYREGWIDAIPKATARLWSKIAKLMIILFPVSIAMTNGMQFSGVLKMFSGGLTFASLIGSIWESFLCVGMCIALLALFRNRFSSQGRIAKAMADNSFTVYLIHIPIIVFLQYLLIGVPIDPLIKFVIVGAIGIPLVFAISHFMIRRLPYAKYILG
jgi:glucan biosynthesis protein C